ncbi:Chitin binding domain-containing protein [Strongyloides ratti]|uniref:Chitin binding domain-containing protein n=1 Tax=Strongyloides ratti TaxID=34506 RepID=A0A090KVK3_STRRB|nr:Chitin binding domain-containing protein [Strongyloides ratti]CEF59257.1 Chitin binding domain-containing protein [Strongyloides ratti]
MIHFNLNYLYLYFLFIGVLYCNETKTPETWEVILGDVCQLPNFPRPTADPKRYLECIKQKVSLDRNDLGTWQLRECLDGFKFVASSRSCKSISTIRKSQALCDSLNASKYDYCNDNRKIYTISETIQNPRKCTCPNGDNNCVCPQPEILSPKLLTNRLKRQLDKTEIPVLGNSYKITINLPSCPCNTMGESSCACIDRDLNKVQVYKDTCCMENTPSFLTNQHVCLCNDYQTSSVGPTITTTTISPQVPFVYTTTTIGSNIINVNGKNCQITTTGELYCPEDSQYTYTEPQSCPLVVSGIGNARYQGICSWMTDPLAVDPESKTHFLQCQPAPKNLYCGRWQRMPCPKSTVFDVNIQVCVWDTSSSGKTNGIETVEEIPLLPPQQTTSTIYPPYRGESLTTTKTPYISPYITSFTQPPTVPYTTTQYNEQYNQCSCKGGIPIGTCNQNYQCPGQSLCQISINIETKQNCKVCCYYKKK